MALTRQVSEKKQYITIYWVIPGDWSMILNRGMGQNWTSRAPLLYCEFRCTPWSFLLKPLYKYTPKFAGIWIILSSWYFSCSHHTKYLDLYGRYIFQRRMSGQPPPYKIPGFVWMLHFSEEDVWSTSSPEPALVVGIHNWSRYVTRLETLNGCALIPIVKITINAHPCMEVINEGPLMATFMVSDFWYGYWPSDKRLK